MKELRSFKDVIENHFFDQIENAVTGYVAENLGSLNLRSYRVREADEVVITDLTVKRVDVHNEAGTSIRFDVITEAEIVVSERYHSDIETDEIGEWFRVSCRGDLDDGLRNFSILNVDTYSRSKRSPDALTDELVPVIAKEQFDDIADQFLRDHYPKALDEPMAVDVREVARRMGLTIKEARLSRHFTIFGEMVFSDCEVTL
jgi:hypothetical protein